MSFLQMQIICKKNILFAYSFFKQIVIKFLHMNLASFEQSGLKKTKHRILVLKTLDKNEYPVSAEQLYFQLKKENINLSTIYRILNIFEEKGIVKKEVNQNKENVYSLVLKEDSHYLVCVKCHKRTPLPGCPYHEINEQIEEETGYQILDHNTEIYGICPECKNK